MENVVSAKHVNAVVPVLFLTCSSILSVIKLFCQKLCQRFIPSSLSISFQKCAHIVSFYSVLLKQDKNLTARPAVLCFVQTQRCFLLNAKDNFANMNTVLIRRCGQIEIVTQWCWIKGQGIAKLSGFTIWELSVTNFVLIHLLIAKIFNPKPKNVNLMVAPEKKSSGDHHVCKKKCNCKLSNSF